MNNWNLEASTYTHLNDLRQQADGARLLAKLNVAYPAAKAVVRHVILMGRPGDAIRPVRTAACECRAA